MTIKEALIPYIGEENIIIFCRTIENNIQFYIPIFIGLNTDIPRKYYNLKLISDTLVNEAKRMELVENAIEFCLGDYRLYYVENPKNN